MIEIFKKKGLVSGVGYVESSTSMSVIFSTQSTAGSPDSRIRARFLSRADSIISLPMMGGICGIGI